MKVDKSKWEKKTLGDLCTAGSSNIVVSKTQIGVGEYPLFGASGKVGNIDFYHNTEDYLGLVKDGSGVGRIDKYPAYSSLVGTMQYLYPTELANIDYLKYLISYLNLAKYVKGAAIPHIYYRHYKNEQIRVPNLLEQQSIASELDAIQSMIDGYKAQLEDLDELAKSIFLDMFGDPVENPKGWEKRELGGICEVTSSKRIYQSEQTKWGVPFYRIGDFTKLIKDGISNPELFISIEKYNALKNAGLVPSKGDILLTSRGTLGLSYIVNENDRFYFQDGMITWLKNINKDILSSFIGFIFKASLCEEQIKKMKNGSTVAYLSISMIKAFKIIVPPIILQQQFAAKIEAIESQKEKYEAQLLDGEQLMAERMQYYFS